jgi:hypothetical protein
MATLEQLSSALVKADAAGNAADAKALAMEIKRMRGETQTPAAVEAAPETRQNVGAETDRGLFDKTIRNVIGKGADLASVGAGLYTGVGDIVLGGQKLLGQGLTALGAKDTGQALTEDAIRRQTMQQQFIAPYEKYAPDLTGASRFTGQVLPTLPAGGLIAKPVQMLGQAVPGLATVTAPIAQSLRTAGFETGLIPKVAPGVAPAIVPLGTKISNALAKVVGGATVGGTTSALINPEEAESGAVIGAGLPFVVPPAAKYIAVGAGKFIDAATGNLVNVEAGKIARQAAGDSINQIRAANGAAPLDINAAQAAYGIDNDVYQAFLGFVSGKDKSSYYRVLKDKQKTEQLNQLARLAGGPSLTENLTSVGEFKNALNNLMTPIRETELAAANIAGTLGPKLQGEANVLGQAATNKVEDVRRFVAAGDRAANLATQRVVEKGLPTSTARYTYIGELADKADEVATKAAEGSLVFGEAARFKQAATDSLAAYGLKPLTATSVTSRINGILRNPEFAGNDVIEGAVKSFGDDVAKWTNSDGVIDAFALDSLRKNSVNAAVEKLRPGLDQTAKKNLAAGVIAQLKTPIINAVEEAGGTAYGQYLRDYAANAQLIDRRKLAGKALAMFKTSPDEFIKLVQGDNPDAVAKVFGPGSFNIFKEMGVDIKPMQQIADELTRDLKIAEQAKAGAKALGFEDESLAKKIPGFVGYKTAIVKQVIRTLENKVSDKTIEVLANAAKSGKSMNEILNTLPADDRIKVLKALKNASNLSAAQSGAANFITAPPTNALAPEQQNQNALAR